MGITAINLPIMPEINIMGVNATTVVVIAITTGPPTSFRPSITAIEGGFPLLWCLNMFSPTIMASSTSIPRVMIKAKRDIMLIVSFKESSTIKAAIKEMGIPTATQNARRKFKNKARMIKTSVIP